MISARYRRWAGFATLAVALAGVGVGAGAPASTAAPDTQESALLDRIKDWHGELHDMTATLEVKHENNDALKKISGDFAQLVRYGFRKLKYYYKAPDKVRMESSATLFHFLRGVSIRNGNRKDIYVPTFGIHRTADLTGAPNKMETSLDWGLIDGDLWTNYRIWLIRSETDGGRLVYVLGLKPNNGRKEGTMVARLDGETLKVLSRDRYNADGQLQQHQVFTNFVHPLPHVWLPTDIKLYNNAGQFGGDLVYSHFAVNTGLPDSRFH